METAGQQVTFALCEIFRFDDEGRIVHEESYYDVLAVTKQIATGYRQTADD
jgi:hypothetical protein